MSSDYRPQRIEQRWQGTWTDSAVYTANNQSDRPKYYCLNFFPYASGEGLHVGHCRNYLPTDVIARYKRMRGFNVLHPMGWDAFGEPTEQSAMLHGLHPRKITDRNTANFKRQMERIGLSYDWSREIDSSSVDYYRWTQWFFLLLYRRGLAYRDYNWQWWCPTCQTTLSSHEAAGGVCWRGHAGVTKRRIPAWYFKITAYAEELLSGLETVDWPSHIKRMQRNWIGRSEGWEFDFHLENGSILTAFTTRPDTLFGTTYLALAPEHPALLDLVTSDRVDPVNSYLSATVTRPEAERAGADRRPSGIFTGAYVFHPLTGDQIPVWVADYVLPGYGTGAVMGVPAHDPRDLKFARDHRLPIRMVVTPPGQTDHDPEEAYTGEGRSVNSGAYTGLPSDEAGQRIATDAQANGTARPSVHYRMRDWLISRQRYWGAPIPIVYCENCGETPVPEAELPVELPEMKDFAPDGTGRAPLARADDFVKTRCPSCDGPAQRETNTMGGFACSSWYFLRFTSPHHPDAPFDPDAARYWTPVDLYVGGAEHAVLHLLYARFWTKVMADAGLVNFREPFQKLLNQGVVRGPDGHRMSKSRGNVITPDEVVAEHGADALRIYALFVAPFEQDVDWNTDGIRGAVRFLQRIWRIFSRVGEQPLDAGPDAELSRARHRLAHSVTERIEGFRFNTMISELMEFVSLLERRQRQGMWQTAAFHESLETLLLLLAPAAPHLAEELWHRIGKMGSIHKQSWPTWDPEQAAQDQIELPVQINGRLRAVIQISRDASEHEARERAGRLPTVQEELRAEIQRIIYVPGRVINFVTTGSARDSETTD